MKWYDALLNALKYLWRDKIDLTMFFITAITFVVTILKEVSFDNAWLGFCTLWIFGAIYRMGTFLNR